MLQRHTMEPGQLWNMLTLSAVLVDQAMEQASTQLMEHATRGLMEPRQL